MPIHRIEPHAHIEQAIRVCADHTAGTAHVGMQVCRSGAKRAKQTEIINATFVKTAGGGYITNPGAPCFQEMMCRKEEKWMSEEQGGYLDVCLNFAM